MVQTMLNPASATRVSAATHPQATATLRKLMGLAVLGSGYAVIFAHGLAHLVRG